jgi:hypothetical protein
MLLLDISDHHLYVKLASMRLLYPTNKISLNSIHKLIYMNSKNTFYWLALFIITSNRTVAQAILQDTLLSINYGSFINKPIDSLLAKLPPTTEYKIRPDNTMFNGAHLIVSYRRQGLYLITLMPGDRNFINKKNPANLPWHEAWPLHLLRKERLAAIEIMGPTGNLLVDLPN